jgi:nucleotide-binding universal stress UspA family protein
MIKLKKLLLPTDFSDSARHAFTYAASFAREYDAALYLLHVVEVLPMGYAGELFPESMTQVVDQISGYVGAELGKLAAEARTRGCKVVHERVERGKPASEVVRVAREEEIDMIVLGTHGHGTFNRALFGSTTDRIMHKAPCPVLVCREFGHEFVDAE